MKRGILLAATLAAGLAAAAMAFVRILRPCQRRWGATDEEVERAMPGDEIVAKPDYVCTRAITVNARPADIYPWLVQMGYQRGGLYSFDFLDRLFGILDAPSATRILPEFQHLKVGDVIPIGEGPGFPVQILDPDRAFVLGDPDVGWTWQTCFYPIDDEHTRLVTRNRAKITSLWGSRLFIFWLDLAAFVMTARWLIVLRGRAEMLAHERRAGAASPPLPGTRPAAL